MSQILAELVMRVALVLRKRSFKGRSHLHIILFTLPWAVLVKPISNSSKVLAKRILTTTLVSCPRPYAPHSTNRHPLKGLCYSVMIEYSIDLLEARK